MKSLKIAAAFALATTGSLAIAAETPASTMNVTATVTSSCSITSVGALAFPSVDAVTLGTTAQKGTADIVVQCTNGTAYDVKLASDLTLTHTTDATATLPYELHSDLAATTVWGSTVGTNTVNATSDGSAATHTVYGTLPAATNALVGSYTDSVTVTVAY